MKRASQLDLPNQTWPKHQRTSPTRPNNWDSAPSNHQRPDEKASYERSYWFENPKSRYHFEKLKKNNGQISVLWNVDSTNPSLTRTCPQALQAQVVVNLCTYFREKGTVKEIVCFGTHYTEGMRLGCLNQKITCKSVCVDGKGNNFVACVVELAAVAFSQPPPHLIVLVTEFHPSLTAMVNFMTSEGYDILLVTPQIRHHTEKVECEILAWNCFLPKQSKQSSKPISYHDIPPSTTKPFVHRAKAVVQLSNSQIIEIEDDEDKLMAPSSPERDHDTPMLEDPQHEPANNSVNSAKSAISALPVNIPSPMVIEIIDD